MADITLTINGKKVTAQAGQTLLQVCRAQGIDIPTLCYLEDLFPSGACRMCVVEVEGARGLMPSCAFPAAEGQVVHTHSPRARRARKTIVELLLANHPQECLTCVKSGKCELQSMAQDLGVRDKRYEGQRREYAIDASSASLIRDPEKCILCGRCVRVCEEVQGVAAIDFTNRGFQTVIAPAFNQSLNNTPCVNCGQCILVCPTGALREQSSLKEVWDAINDPDKFVVTQVAPAIRATIGEEFGMPPGSRVTGKLAAALRRAGFDRVFDTDVAADLTIMEEGSELVQRLTTNGVLPMITSCSPGWVKYIEHFYPEELDHLSTAKSPHEMLGVLLKTYYAEKEGINPSKIIVVSIMPCTAKKYEAERPELSDSGYQDVDYVLTTREAARLIKLAGVKFENLPDEAFDPAFGMATGAAVIFGATGGVMEAALRTAQFLLTVPAGETAPAQVTREMLGRVDFSPVRGLDGVKDAEVDLHGIKLKVAVAHGLKNARTLIEQVQQGTSPYHFIEVMGCPGGCIGGGGSPMPTNTAIRKKRMEAIYNEDEAQLLRASHDNPIVKQLYDEFLGKPLSHKAHELLHTHYIKRGL